MTTYKDIRGTHVTTVTSDPPAPVNGQVWYNSTTQVMKGFTSQVTYKVQFACRGNATSETAYIGQTGNDGNNNEQQRTPCHLRLMEIAG